jgi:L-lactate permease
MSTNYYIGLSIAGLCFLGLLIGMFTGLMEYKKPKEERSKTKINVAWSFFVILLLLIIVSIYAYSGLSKNKLKFA